MFNQELQVAILDNNIRIAYTEHGQRKHETILFIHGLANYLRVWSWNIAGLENHFHCIAIDLPGNGFSSRGDYPYDMEFFAETLFEFCEKTNLKKVILAGHSMGGQIAMTMALKYPELVNSLLLFAPAGFEYYTPQEALLFKSAITLGDFLNMDEVHISQSINSSFFRQNKISAQIIKDLNDIIKSNDRGPYRKMLDRCMNAMLNDQWFYKLPKLPQPALVFFGERDMLIPNRFLHPVSTKEIGEKGVAQMQNARLITYPDTGHFVQIEAFESVNKEILNLQQGC
ncbi:MAG: alpha/beta hydrolase [Chitinophagaceae bacterium]|nr:alpha/beta hydrolase [Chitinophagaceae bacterium]